MAIANANERQVPPPRSETTPGVGGGDARVAGTRITVWVLEQARRLGATVEQLLEEYPTLTRRDVEDAWAYAKQHAVEINRQIHENEVASPMGRNDCEDVVRVA